MSDTLIKICGVTREDQAQAIAAMGADLIGINFWPRSKRFLPVENAGWLSKVPSSTRLIGVFVNPDLEYLSKITDLGALQGIQLHGDETPQFCAEVEAAFGIP
ncbi:MAG: N-(5'-phosphoribosyl)anthranilate isomerase, partial [Verrucomicrobium sp.]